MAALDSVPVTVDLLRASACAHKGVTAWNVTIQATPAR